MCLLLCSFVGLSVFLWVLLQATASNSHTLHQAWQEMGLGWWSTAGRVQQEEQVLRRIKVKKRSQDTSNVMGHRGTCQAVAPLSDSQALQRRLALLRPYPATPPGSMVEFWPRNVGLGMAQGCLAIESEARQSNG